ncbi:sugar phosphate isomerase/epimerase family protein [Candidatus Poriferisocius sp.]|uniref:sugar phosphate isomerase/epimerase family protein n=1 Tax=Candidatus Poriferisocius sp. TaxID=3101276 RepID=UPI003B020E82
MTGQIYLGTVAIEPNRWGLAEPGGNPLTRVSEWLSAIGEAGFDGLELWERHARSAPDEELDALLASELPIEILSCYTSWDEPDDADRAETAAWIERVGAQGVKFNVGSDTDSIAEYTERLRRFEAEVPDGARLLCECHFGTVAEDPAVARDMFDAIAGADRLGAIVHVHPMARDEWSEPLGVLGDRVRHVHVQVAEVAQSTSADELSEMLRPAADAISAASPNATWTIEFSYGMWGFGRDDAEFDNPAYILQSAQRDLVALRAAL